MPGSEIFLGDFVSHTGSRKPLQAGLGVVVMNTSSLYQFFAA